ncbi:MAG: hypothetical protein D6679_08770 [Candidatus Hydrogenedentota bacterium]|nr:MAG: hypothetical protein D6679_08770 [Candidatus Hydrogenedentota bacterium]
MLDNMDSSGRKAMDFTVIIPKMREEIEAYRKRKNNQGKNLSLREATVLWLDRYYEKWLEKYLGLPSQDRESALESEKEEPRGAERRRFRRIPIEISAFYRVLWVPEQPYRESAPLTETGHIKNLSAGGLYIVTGSRYPISTLLEIQFELPTIPESISAFAMVVWSEEKGNGLFGHGLHFSHIETRDVDLINEAIMERLLDAPVINLKSEK